MTLALLVGASALAAAQVPVGSTVELEGRPVHPTRLLARLAPAPADEARLAAAALATTGSTIVRAVPLVPGLLILDEIPTAAAVAGGAAGARADPDAQARALHTRLLALRSTGRFLYVEPDHLLSLDARPTDGRFIDGTLWGLENTGQNGGVAAIDIDVVRAWDITTGSTDIIVAVVDTGINYTHADLRAQMWRNPGEIAGNGRDDDGNGFIDDVFGVNAITGSGDPRDDHDHGSHVAGTIGAAAGDDHPHVGVAWQVRLMACKFLSAEGYGFNSDAVTCVDYAVTHGARILNASWGGGGYSQSLVDAINRAGAHDVLFVAAAGNSAVNLQGEIGERYPSYPAEYDVDAIIAVAALDRRGELAEFSNFGALSVDLAAPGVDVFSAGGGLAKHGYRTFSGTSMAAPHVAGVAALALAAHPTLKVGELRSLLLATVTPTASLEGKTASGGRVSAYRAVAAAPDGTLELGLTLPAGSTLYGGQDMSVFAHVTDLFAVPNATVTGTIDGGATLEFLDDGLAPDVSAGDGSYAAMVTVPMAATEVRLEVRADATGFVGVASSATLQVAPRPTNDDFAHAEPLSGLVALATGSNVGASRQRGEGEHAGVAGGASVWWTWTAPADTTVTVEVGTVFYSVLGVYTGTGVAALSTVASSDNVDAGNPASAVEFLARAGTTYHFAVDGQGGATGYVGLSLKTTLPPPNDGFANRIASNGATIATAGTTRLATNEPGVPHDDSEGGSVWWEWTPPAGGTAVIMLLDRGGSNVIDVLQGTTAAALIPVANLTTKSYRVSNTYRFHVRAGESYQIAVRSEALEGDWFSLKVDLVEPPANDEFALRSVLTGDRAMFFSDTRGATRESGEPLVTELAGLSTSLWYTWTAPRDSNVFINARRGFRAAMAAFTGDTLAALQLVARGDHDAFGLFFRDSGNTLSFAATAGTTYQILVDAVEAITGVAEVRLELIDPPANDRIEHRSRLVGESVRVAATNHGALGEPDEPLLYEFDRPLASVWWEWTAPRPGRAVVRVTDTTILPVIRVFVATPSGSPSPVFLLASQSDRAVFEVEAGSTYLISIDSERFSTYFSRSGDARGPFTLEVAVVDPPTNDHFAGPTVISGAAAVATATNVAARSDPAADFDVQVPLATLWWTWTAPADGRAVVSTAGSSFATILAVFTGSEPGALTRVAVDDGERSGTGASTVTFPVVAGTAYRIAVDGRFGATGDVVLTVRSGAPPANDAFAAAVILDGSSVTAHVSNVGATAQPGEPSHADLPAERSVWWRWTAPADGDVAVSTIGSDFDTILGVYTGAMWEGLSLVAANDDASGGGLESRVVFRASGGTTYHLVVDGFFGDVGAIAVWVQPFALPMAGLEPPAVAPIAGGEVVLRATATGSGPFAYQWRRNGVPLAGATGATLTLPCVQLTDTGGYSVVVRGVGGTSSSATWILSVPVPPPSLSRLVNLSTRGHLRSGEGQLIPGFVLRGSGTRRLLIRAVGPTLSLPPIELGGAVLPDPRLALLRFDPATGAYADFATNDNWVDAPDAVDIAFAAESLHAFELKSPIDAAVLVDLPPGQYTVSVGDSAGRAGIGLVELYDVEEASAAAPGARLINLSNRGFAGVGDRVMIPGFVISAEGAKTLLVRVVGPTLASDFGVVGAMMDPRLTIHRVGQGAAILAQDNWGDHADAAGTAQVAQQVSAFPLAAGSRDAAFVVTLSPGVYTVVGSGVSEADTGVILVELYEVP